MLVLIAATVAAYTPITADPEILERRYPVVLRRFCLRQGSGGAGKWRGGDGVIREVSGAVAFFDSKKVECCCCSPACLLSITLTSDQRSTTVSTAPLQ